MIRYVVAVLLATAVLGTAVAALDAVSAVRGETQVEGEIAAIEAAAVSLMEDDPVPADGNPPRRVLDIDFPSGGFASASMDRLVFEPLRDANRTAVRYRVEERSANAMYLDAPIVNAAVGSETLDLSGRTGSRTLVLELGLDGTDSPVIRATIR